MADREGVFLRVRRILAASRSCAVQLNPEWFPLSLAEGGRGVILLVSERLLSDKCLKLIYLLTKIELQRADLEQKPFLWLSLIQSPLEHSRRHCLPLNFFLTPVFWVTTSPFLNLCWKIVPVGSLTELEDGGRDDGWSLFELFWWFASLSSSFSLAVSVSPSSWLRGIEEVRLLCPAAKWLIYGLSLSFYCACPSVLIHSVSSCCPPSSLQHRATSS